LAKTNLTAITFALIMISDLSSKLAIETRTNFDNTATVNQPSEINGECFKERYRQFPYAAGL
jgi:hypothetical protein